MSIFSFWVYQFFGKISSAECKWVLCKATTGGMVFDWKYLDRMTCGFCWKFVNCFRWNHHLDTQIVFFFIKKPSVFSKICVFLSNSKFFLVHEMNHKKKVKLSHEKNDTFGAEFYSSNVNKRVFSVKNNALWKIEFSAEKYEILSCIFDWSWNFVKIVLFLKENIETEISVIVPSIPFNAKLFTELVVCYGDSWQSKKSPWRFTILTFLTLGMQAKLKCVYFCWHCCSKIGLSTKWSCKYFSAPTIA